MSAGLAVQVEDVKPQADGLLRMLMGFEVSQVLMVSHQLGVFDTLAQEPAAAEAVCRRLGIPSSSGQRLLQACAALGLLELQGGVLSNSALADLYLVPGKTSYLGGLVDYYQGEFYDCYGKLSRAIRENRAQVQDLQGSATDLFTAAEKESGLQRRFLEAMHRLGLWEGNRLADMFPFDQVHTLLDVGGGSGALAIALAQRYPHLSIRIFDRPTVCPVTRGYIESARVGDRVGVVPGDFWYDELPRKADAILLSMVLHDWSPAKNRDILARCYAALPSGGQVLIFEQLLNDDRCGPTVACLTNLTMLLRTESGSEYTEQDYRHLMQNAGFHQIRTVRAPGLRQLLAAVKP